MDQLGDRRSKSAPLAGIGRVCGRLIVLPVVLLSKTTPVSVTARTEVSGECRQAMAQAAASGRLFAEKGYWEWIGDPFGNAGRVTFLSPSCLNDDEVRNERSA